MAGVRQTFYLNAFLPGSSSTHSVAPVVADACGLAVQGASEAAFFGVPECLISAKERVAFEQTEALTQIAPEGHLKVSDELYAATRGHFTEAELSDLTFRVAAINGCNRLNVAFRNPPASKDKMFGLDQAALN